MELDANSKLGSKHIPGDPKEQSSNGKLLEKVVEDNELVVVNGTYKVCLQNRNQKPEGK